MSAEQKKDNPNVVWVTMPVDLETFAWLTARSQESRALPEVIAAAVLHDVRVDDEAMHVTTVPEDDSGATLQ
jgi:hypothetical protein